MTRHALPKLGSFERAVYELVIAGRVNVGNVALYRGAIGALAAHDLITKRPDGVYAPTGDAVAPSTPPPPPVPLVPREPPMPSLLVRIPQAQLDALDALGPTRSEAARAAIARGLQALSGTRKRAG